MYDEKALDFDKSKPYVTILGIAQDGGYPQTGCYKKCCSHIKSEKYVSCLAVVLPNETKDQIFYFDCTPDFKYQLNHFDLCHEIKGIFITHAHIGHYLGLVNLGRECMNTHNTPVYAMEKMSNFLKTNAPFTQLMELNNIKIQTIKSGDKVFLNDDIYVEPFRVKHRGEFSETCGYKIKSPNKSIIFIPDIDSWEDENEILPNTNYANIKKLIFENDMLFLDGTFYSPDEITNRNIKEIPHPFIIDSLKIFDSQVSDTKEKNKINFIHLNHTNPCIDSASNEYKFVISQGYKIANQFDCFNI